MLHQSTNKEHILLKKDTLVRCENISVNFEGFSVETRTGSQGQG